MPIYIARTTGIPHDPNTTRSPEVVTQLCKNLQLGQEHIQLIRNDLQAVLEKFHVVYHRAASSRAKRQDFGCKSSTTRW
jgi:hypothetical protein